MWTAVEKDSLFSSYTCKIVVAWEFVSTFTEHLFSSQYAFKETYGRVFSAITETRLMYLYFCKT